MSEEYRKIRSNHPVQRDSLLPRSFFGCPLLIVKVGSNAGTRHGTCRSCKARQTLAACGIHVWFEHDDLEACRNCGVVRREDDGNKPCKGKVALALR